MVVARVATRTCWGRSRPEFAGVLSFRAAVQAVRNLAKANALAYDAVHRHDRRARAWDPCTTWSRSPSPPPRARGRPAGTRHAEHLQPRAPERGRQGPRRRRRGRPYRRRAPATCAAPTSSVNYYFRSRVLGLAAWPAHGRAAVRLPAHERLRAPAEHERSPCPTDCTEFGWEIFPAGLRRSLEIAGSYEPPVYVTENGSPIPTTTGAPPTSSTICARCEPRCARGRPTSAATSPGRSWTTSSGRRLLPALRFFSYDENTLARTERPSAGVPPRGTQRSPAR